MIEFWIDIKVSRGVLATWTLEIDGEEVQSKKLSAEGKATTRGYFQIKADGIGEHYVVVRSSGAECLSGSFTVIETPDTVTPD